MRLLYHIGIHIFYVLVKIASLRNSKAKLWINGRKGQLNKIRETFDGAAETVWVHCASLGEFEQARPLIKEIKKRYPNKKIILTFYSPSGYEVQKDFKGVDMVSYLPLDTRLNAKRFVKYVNPQQVFFIKYEYWFNFLSALKKRNIPVYFVSAIFRPDQLFFKKYGQWYQKMLMMVTHFFIQTDDSAKLLDSIHITNYTVCGDTRFDRVANIVENVKPLDVVENFINGDPVIIAGSTWKAEEALLRQYIRKNQHVKLIIVPHEIENGSVDRILEQYGDLAVRYSQAHKGNNKNRQVLVVDCYGLLTSLYQYGKIAVVGGGFGVGIHNILEAATYGMPILFGPKYERFREAIDLVEQNCAFPVNNVEEFNTVMNYLLQHPETTQKIADMAAAYVVKNVGATRKIIEAVF